MECHSKWNVVQNGMSFKMECHSKWNVTENGMSLNLECRPKWNVTQNGIRASSDSENLSFTQKTLGIYSEILSNLA